MPLSSGRIFDYSDDAAVAKLLADEAKASSTRYATQGLSALLPKRATGTAPKPNTRFLKNLVRDADQHNAALRRKEDRERVERLRNGGLKSREASREAGQRSRSETNGDSHRDSKRRRLDDGHNTKASGADRREHRRPTQRKRNRSESRSRSESEDGATRRRQRHKDRRHESGKDNAKHRPEHNTEASHRKHRRRRSRSPSRDRHHRLSRSPDQGHRRGRRASSSDPLEDLIGPLPRNKDDTAPVRYRGRGAHKLASTSNIDDHFSAKYDPTLDVQPDAENSDEREDWDMALEALRDRQAYQKKYADRLRVAGFDGEEIQKWNDSGREKDIRDVQWRTKGQTREWDVGKSNEEREGRLTP